MDTLKIVVVFIFFALAVGAFIYIKFFVKQKKSWLEYEKSIDDDTELLDVLTLHDKPAGEPLVFFATPDKKVDEWRENMPYFSISSEERGMVLGISGAGKTTFLMAQLVNWIQSGKSFVVTDIKPEIWATLNENGVLDRYGYESIIINPTDKMASKYNPFDDLGQGSETEIIELVEILISDNDAFSDGARRIMRAVMFHLIKLQGSVSLTSARLFLRGFNDKDELLSALTNSPSDFARQNANETMMIAGNERFLSSVINAVVKSLDFLDNSTISSNMSRSDISLREELLKPKRAIFLQFEQDYKNSVSKLFAITLSHILRLLQMNHHQRDDVLICIDELINASVIPDLTSKLNTMRSAKMPTFLYFQTLSKLNDLYGNNADNIFMSACSLKICYRVNDIDTATTISRMIGEVEVKSISSSETPKMAENGRSYTSKTLSETTIKKLLVEPSDLIKMEDGKAVVMYKGMSSTAIMPRHYVMYPMKNRPSLLRPSMFYTEDTEVKKLNSEVTEEDTRGEDEPGEQVTPASSSDIDIDELEKAMNL